MFLTKKKEHINPFWDNRFDKCLKEYRRRFCHSSLMTRRSFGAGQISENCTIDVVEY
jgi:hypothetical protein